MKRNGGSDSHSIKIKRGIDSIKRNRGRYSTKRRRGRDSIKRKRGSGENGLIPNIGRRSAWGDIRRVTDYHYTENIGGKYTSAN